MQTFSLEEVEVDVIEKGKAIKYRKAEGKLEVGKSANKTYSNFALSKSDAEARVLSSLKLEMEKRFARLIPLCNRYTDLTGNSYELRHILA